MLVVAYVSYRLVSVLVDFFVHPNIIRINVKKKDGQRVVKQYDLKNLSDSDVDELKFFFSKTKDKKSCFDKIKAHE